MTLALLAKLIFGISIAAFVLFVGFVRVGKRADDNDAAMIARMVDGDTRTGVREP